MKKTIVVVLIALMTVGFNWGLAQTRGEIITITVKNQFPIPVVVQLNSNYAGNIPANSSLKIRASINKVPLQIDIWGFEIPKIIATKTFEKLFAGQDIIWATGNVELNPIFPSAPPPPQPVPEQAPPKAAAPPTTAAPIVVTPPQAAPKVTASIPVAAPPQAAIIPSASKSSQVTYMKSASTFSYQGTKSQNQVKTSSLAKIERQTLPAGFIYTLSGDGAALMGKAVQPAFYGVAPIKMSRSATNRLSSDQKGLGPWLETANRTLDGLTHKRMAPGAWEEFLTLPFGEIGPATIRTQFRARALPAPDDKWILITANSGLMSFRALSKEDQDATIYGRYQGVLIYAPAEDELLQAAAAFTLYRGEDQFRIEQAHFAADASGNQLYPALDVGTYLNFAPTDPAIVTPGAFPSWCIQTAHIFDFVDLAVMTAAEGATNPSPSAAVAKSMLSLHNQTLKVAQQVLGNAGAQDFMGKWSADLMRAATQGIGDWNFWLRDIASLDLPVNGARISGPGNWSVDINKPLYVSAKKMINGRMYDIKLINDLPYAAPTATPQPTPPTQTVTAQPTTPPPSASAPPPDNVQMPEAAGSAFSDLPLVAGLVALGVGTYLVASGKLNLGGGDDCAQYAPAPCPKNPPGEYTGAKLPASCGCPNGMHLAEQEGDWIWCSGCPSSLGVSSLRLTTRTKR